MRYTNHEKEINTVIRQQYQDAKKTIEIHLDMIKALQMQMEQAINYLEYRHDISYREARHLVAK